MQRRQLLQFLSGISFAHLSEPLLANDQNLAQHPEQHLDQAIQKHRTAPLHLQLLNAAGEPLPRHTITIQHLRHHFQFGCAYHQHLAEKTNETIHDRRLRSYFLQLFNAATVTFYWAGYEPQRGNYQSQPLLEKINWLTQRNFYLRGHPLYWNHNPACLPPWVWMDGYTQPPALLNLMDELLSHLTAVIFPYLMDVDVFNELTWWHNYDHPFTKLMHGDQKIKIATTYFRKFNQQNPRLLATINDFLPNHEYPHLIRQLLDNSAPIQAIGQQTHMHQGNWSHARLATILDRLGNFSKPIIFTEVSVLSAPLQPQLDYSRTYTDWYSTPQGEAQQAQYLVNFYKLLFAHPLVQGIYLWSFSDRSAWLGAPTGILDRENRPKPAYQALDQLINHQWRTSGEFQSNDQGIISIPNAFSGEYLLTNGKQQIPLGDHSPAQPLSRSITLT